MVHVKEATRELQRETDLFNRKVTTQADFDRVEAVALAIRAKLQQQEADVAVAERSVESWKQQLADTIIRAPFSGIVTSKNAQPGEMISPMSSGGFTRTGICTIVDMESLEIEIDVNESYINRVEPGQPVEATLDAYPDWKIPCKVIAIVPTADRQKSTVKVRVGFEKPDPRILPEMSVKVSFRDAGRTAPVAAKGAVLPAAALFQENGRDYVYVARDNRAERRAVTVASRSADQVVLSAGTSPGERVLLDKPSGLTDGVPIKELDPGK
jgi:HlyD family secretion protein